MSTAIIGKKPGFLTLVNISFLTTIVSYFIRLLPAVFGLHTITQLIFMIIIQRVLLQVPWSRSTFGTLFSGFLLAMVESISIPFLANLFSYDIKEVLNNPILRLLLFTPHLFILIGFRYLALKREWFPICFEGFLNDKAFKQRASYQLYLLMFCLIQIFVLAFLNINLYIYNAGIYRSFTLSTLLIVINITIFTSIATSILMVQNLLKVTKKQVQLESQLSFTKELHTLNTKIQSQQHDFLNHLTALYGFIYVKEYTKAQKYMESLYSNVTHLRGMLKIRPPELGALLSIKKRKAEKKNIDFQWKIRWDNDRFVLSADELVQVIGNLLDNAIDAAEQAAEKKINLTVTSNNLGVRIVTVNTCSPIPDSTLKNLFNAGYTTKDKSTNSGLGLYIIKEIVEKYGGDIDMQMIPDNSSLQIATFIPG
ncbi:sensor histidine kinase [Candidatus Contubernalis alkaliaceticus]|uniref:sensor histidine kinase n=1 Tax=Candidatus Contubernalis alkaliaceticus TaxID=338645 RepID=UPI001F4C0F82|nr:GHKL domain-containing protein [Candidatus Contubernalis alkalaceticus]UNC93147.1 GHKL domain-containing protein [Candidatus Contubernalis alkalaceticus]